MGKPAGELTTRIRVNTSCMIMEGKATELVDNDTHCQPQLAQLDHFDTLKKMSSLRSSGYTRFPFTTRVKREANGKG
jgi:hypothetical protein